MDLSTLNLTLLLNKLPHSLYPSRWIEKESDSEQARHRRYDEERKRRGSDDKTKVNALLWRTGETCMLEEEEEEQD